MFAIYLPTAAVGYFFLGDCVQPNMLDSLNDGSIKLAASVIITLHLYTAAPIALNPPTLWMEAILKIPTGFYIKHNLLLVKCQGVAPGF